MKSPHHTVLCLWINLFLLLPISLFAKREPDHPNLLFAEVEGNDLKLDLYLPKADSPPLIVWIHGGGWSGGHRYPSSMDWIVDHGYALASISYRMSQTAVFPAQIHDVKAAIRWLRAHADSYGYNATHIIAAGASAGGQLASLLGMSGGVQKLEGNVGDYPDESSRVQTVICYYGANDFILRSKTQPIRANSVGSVVYNLLGGPASVLTEKAVLASAAYHVTRNDPPVLILHGTADKTVLFDQALALLEPCLRAGVPVGIHGIEGAGHGGPIFHSPPYQDLVLRFIQRHLPSPENP